MNNTVIRKDQNCRICKSKNIIIVFDLMPTPPGDLFLSKNKLELSSENFPLKLSLCNQCGYLHLPYVLNPDVSYTNYMKQRLQ